MANFDENVNLKQGSDTGQADAASIQPIGPAEVVWGGTDNRPLENLRARTEILRRYMQNVLYYLDYDRCLIIRSNAAFTLTEPTPGNFELSMVGDDLWIYPSLTPGPNSGGRVRGGRVFVGGLPYSGTPLVNDLILTASAQYTGQRGYFDADDFATANSLTLGANRIQVDLIADPALATNVFQFFVTETPKTKWTIRYGTNGGTTTLAALIAAINADLTSQGTYGIANFLRATTTAAAPAAVFPAPFTGGVVQGAYDAETHQVTAAQMAAFFAATEGGVQVNRLRAGEGLAIGYPKGPVESGVPTPRGGRRQSIWDLPTDRIGGNTSNITPLVGWSLFSTGREPEKIPGSVPIGKMINNEFVFIDGTRIAVGETIRLSESRVMKAALASTVFGSSGAALVGYDGSGLWNSDAALSANPSLPAGTVEAALDAVVAQLAASASTNSGARRIGVESIAGSASVGNGSLSLSAGSIREVFQQMLNISGTSTVPGGLNSRVSEYGHSLHGINPVQKDLGEVAPENISGGGATFARALMAGGTSSLASNRPLTTAFENLEPLSFDYGPGIVLTTNLTITGVGGDTSGVVLSSFLANAVGVQAVLIAACNSAPDGTDLYFLKVRISGATPASFNGWYYLRSVDTVGGGFRLRTLSGGTPNFTGISAGTLTVYQGPQLGNQRLGQKLVAFHLGDTETALAEIATVDDGYAWLRVWDQDQTPNPSALYYSDRTVWRPSAPTPRDTTNILGAVDKALLDGAETGIVVDATTNHHHGGAYTRTHLFTQEVQLVDRSDLHTVGIGTSLFLPTPVSVDGVVAAIPAGYSIVGWICRMRIQASINNAALTTTTYTVPFRSDSTDPNPILTVEGHAQSWNATGFNDGYANYAQVLRPSPTSGDVEYRVSARTNAAFGRLIVMCSGYVLRRT